MAEMCYRCGHESLMFANMPMFPTFCAICDPTPEGVQLIIIETEGGEEE